MRADYVFNVKSVHLQIFPLNFTYCARAEIRYVIATKFQPGGRGAISPRLGTHHVIDP